MMLLTLRGTVFLYEGDEIGMTDVDVPREELVDPVGIRFYPHAGRDPVRTPMQWSERAGRRVHRRRASRRGCASGTCASTSPTSATTPTRS